MVVLNELHMSLQVLARNKKDLFKGIRVWKPETQLGITQSVPKKGVEKVGGSFGKKYIL